MEIQTKLFNEPGDVCAYRHGGNPESRAAFEAIKETLSEFQMDVLAAIMRSTNGMTADDLCVAFDKLPNTISPRVTELRMKGKIFKDGTRPTRSGCKAAVWKAVSLQ